MTNATASPPTSFMSHFSKSGTSSHDSLLEVRVNDVASALLSRLYLWVILGWITYLIYTRYFTGMSHIPGPFIASVSNLWKIKAAWQEAMPQLNIALHKKHGPLVRIGPNTISVDDPAALSTIYGFKPAYRKTAFYPIVEAVYKGKALSNLFTTRSEEYHAHLKRASVNAYSMTTLVDLEPYVQNVIQLFLRRIDEVSEGGKKPFDISTWAQFFSFDALGEINFSEQLGFLETGTDVGNSIATIAGLLRYLSIIGQAPWLHKILLGNPLLHKYVPFLETSNEIQNFAIRMINKRASGEQTEARRDILARLLEVSGKDESRLAFSEIIALTTTNLIAGSDTTAIGIRAILYFLCRHPNVYEKLQKEIDAAFTSGAISSPIKYADGAKLEYLNAVITESLRAHAAIGFVLEREVPKEGATISGTFIPGGTTVGINSWVMHANKQVFGEDAESFRPERWFDSEKRVGEMKRYNMTFGAGPRICIGRNISMMEIIKLIPELMHMYNFRLANPDKQWEVLGHWFTKQTGMDMIFTKRGI